MLLFQKTRCQPCGTQWAEVHAAPPSGHRDLSWQIFLWNPKNLIFVSSLPTSHPMYRPTFSYGLHSFHLKKINHFFNCTLFAKSEKSDSKCSVEGNFGLGNLVWAGVCVCVCGGAIFSLHTIWVLPFNSILTLFTKIASDPTG